MNARINMTTDLELTPEQEKLFQPGCFVALHPESNHPDAGRVGKLGDDDESMHCLRQGKA